MRKYISTVWECREWYEENKYQMVFCKQADTNKLYKKENPIFDSNVESYYVLMDGDLVGFDTLEVVNIQKTRPMTDDEVFYAISQGAKVRSKLSTEVSNYWNSCKDVTKYEICYSNGGKATEEWVPMEVQV